jgi:hypothetical protein
MANALTCSIPRTVRDGAAARLAGPRRGVSVRVRPRT